MLPSVTVTSSVHNHHASSTVLNRVYWIRAGTADSHPRQHRVSTKILGCGVFMIGVVVLAVSLIMGFQFPAHIKQKILKDVCILNKDHEFYEKWSRDSSYVRYNRVYHWHITNPAEFLRGIPPVFTEKGPYVYRERRRQLNVMFQNNLIAYHTMFTQTFSTSHTHSECGNACAEHDKITTINTELLKKIYTYGGLDRYVKAHVRTYTSSLLTNWTNPGNVQELSHLLSCASPKCQNISSYENLTTVEQLLSFGHYVKQNNSIHKETILQSNMFINAAGYISMSFIRMLYNHLSTFESPSSSSCSTSAEVSWTVMLKPENNTTPTSKTPLSHSHPTETSVYFSKGCDISSAVTNLTAHLTQFSNLSLIQWRFSVCEGKNEPCEDMDETQESILALLLVTKRFVDVYLRNAVGEMVLRQPGNSIIITQTQHDLAKGYKRQTHDLDPYPEEDEEGILAHHVDIETAFHNTPAVVVGTCLLHGDNKNNMFIKEYNGSHYVPPGVYQQEGIRVNGYLLDFPPSSSYRACATPSHTHNKYDVFLRELHRSVIFQYAEDIQKYDNQLFLYNISTDAFGGLWCDLINTTAVNKYPSFVGKPAYHGSDCGHLSRQLSSTSADLNSFIQIEPMTGKAWFHSIKLQTSAVIPKELLISLGGHYWSSTSATPVPLYWVDRRAEIVQHEIDYFEREVDRLMQVSCGGLIGLATMSVLIMVLSVFVGVFSTRKNKVADIPQPSNTPNKT